MDETGVAPGSPVGVQQALLEQAKRQTKALEGIHGVLMFLLALAILGVLVALATVINGS